MEVLNLERLYNELKDEYVFLFKIHPFVKNDFNIPYQYKEFFYNFSSYREINDLLFITDILITDYSSVCFEYALLNKPMIFFAYDVEEYVQKEISIMISVRLYRDRLCVPLMSLSKQ